MPWRHVMCSLSCDVCGKITSVNVISHYCTMNEYWLCQKCEDKYGELLKNKCAEIYWQHVQTSLVVKHRMLTHVDYEWNSYANPIMQGSFKVLRSSGEIQDGWKVINNRTAINMMIKKNVVCINLAKFVGERTELLKLTSIRQLSQLNLWFKKYDLNFDQTKMSTRHKNIWLSLWNEQKYYING